MKRQIEQTQQQLLKHHGGDGDTARHNITHSYDNRHDADFWAFWQNTVATNYQPGDGIVDMGAGIGQFVRDCATRYSQSPVFGIEAAPYMLDVPLTLPSNGQILVDDLNHPDVSATAPIAGGSVAMVMANMVVHELTQPIKMFKAAHHWLKVGGRLCIIDVVRQPLEDYLKHRYAETHVWGDDTTVADLEDAFEHFNEHNRYHPADIEFMLTVGGFKLIERIQFRNDRFTRIVVEKV